MSTLTETGCRLEDFVEVLADRTDPAQYPHASAIEQEVLVYDREGLLGAPGEELVHALDRRFVRLVDVHAFLRRVGV